MGKSNSTALYLCVLISGMAGLVYEVLWAKYLALFVGSSGVAHVVVLCTFMGGMALGGRMLGRVVDRLQRPLATYAYLEFLIALYALAFTPIYGASHAMFVKTAGWLGVEAGGLLTAKIAASMMTILIPSFLMGGTLPVVSRHLIRHVHAVGPVISRLYFVNSLGAVAGCLLAGFYLIETYGLSFTMMVGAILNVAAGLTALTVDRSGAEGPEAALPPAMREDAAPGGSRDLSRAALPAVLVCVAASGAVSMFYEIAWIRLLTLVLGSSTYSFSLMLATFILGLSIGGLLLSLRKKPTGYGLIFGCSEIAVGLLVLISLPCYMRLPYWFNQIAASLTREPETFGLYQGAKFLLCALVMFIPTVLQGITLPAATQVLTRNMGRLGGDIGGIFAVNTLGTLLGAATAGGLLMPALGIKGLIELAVGINIVLGFVVLAATATRAERRWAAPAAAFAVVAVLIGYGFGMQSWDRQLLSVGAYRVRHRVDRFESLQQAARERTTVFYRDGLYATVAVQDRPGGDERMLVINGKVDATTKNDLPTQKGLAHLPLLCHPHPERVLVVGVGSGATIGSVLCAPSVKQVDVVEISPDVIEASRLFEAVNGGYWRDPRVSVYQEDAKTFLAVTPHRYDVIINEPTNPWIAGVAGLFSREYFQACSERLRDGGLFCQWFQSYEMDDRTYFLMLETFTSVFPYFTLWNSSASDTIQVGSTRPYAPDFDAMDAYVASPAVHTDLASLGVSSVVPLLAMQMVDNADRPSHVSWFGAHHTDLFPILDYAAPRGFFVGASAEGARRLDHRTRAPAAARLWILEYLRQRPIDPAAYQETFRFFARYPALFEHQPHSWAEAWVLAHPLDPDAAFTFAGLRPVSGEHAAAELDRFADTGPPRHRPAALDAAFRRRMNDYLTYRHALASGRAEKLLHALEVLETAGPPDPGLDLHRMKAQLLLDAGRADEAEDLVASLLPTLSDHPASARAMREFGMLLADASLQRNRPDQAEPFARQVLAPFADHLNVHLKLAEIRALRTNQPGRS